MSTRRLECLLILSALTLGFANGAEAQSPGLTAEAFTLSLSKKQVLTRADNALRLSNLTPDVPNDYARGGRKGSITVLIHCLETGEDRTLVNVIVANSGQVDEARSVRDAVSQYMKSGKAPKSDGISGEWTTKWSGGQTVTLRLTQKGNKVTGVYEGGTIEGTLTGNVLRFRWVQSNRSGAGKFTFAPGGTSFEGAYSYGEDADAADYYWNGKRSDVEAEEKSKP